LFDAKPDSQNQLKNSISKKPLFKNRPEIKQDFEVKKDDPIYKESLTSFDPEETNSISKPDNSIFGKDSHKIPPKFENKINPRVKRVNEKN